jgi:hypothetical protein
MMGGMNLQEKQYYLDRIRESLNSPEDLAYLSKLDAGEIKDLSEQIEQYQSRVEEAQKPIYQTMAFATQFLPNFLVAKISQEMLTPFVIGQVTNCFKPKDAAKIATHFRKEFLGEVALYADRKHTAAITVELPFDIAYGVMTEMIRKGYFSRLGELADELPESLLMRFLQKFTSPSDVAKIAMHMTNTGMIQSIFSKEKEDRRNAVIAELKRMDANLDLGT